MNINEKSWYDLTDEELEYVWSHPVYYAPWWGSRVRLDYPVKGKARLKYGIKKGRGKQVRPFRLNYDKIKQSKCGQELISSHRLHTLNDHEGRIAFLRAWVEENRADLDDQITKKIDTILGNTWGAYSDIAIRVDDGYLKRGVDNTYLFTNPASIHDTYVRLASEKLQPDIDYLTQRLADLTRKRDNFGNEIDAYLDKVESESTR